MKLRVIWVYLSTSKSHPPADKLEEAALAFGLQRLAFPPAFLCMHDISNQSQIESSQALHIQNVHCSRDVLSCSETGEPGLLTGGII